MQRAAPLLVRHHSERAPRLGETTSHSLLAKSNLAPPLLARFQNGLLYKFIRGHVCTPEDLTREPIWRGVSRRLAQWHAVLPIVDHEGSTSVVTDEGRLCWPLADSSSPSDDSPGLEAVNAIAPRKAKPNIWTVMQKWILALPSGTEAEKARNSVLQTELERTVEELGDIPSLGNDGV